MIGDRETEIARLERRASEEIDAAQRDGRPRVSRVHYELAVLYFEKADELAGRRRLRTRQFHVRDWPAFARLRIVCEALTSCLPGALCTVTGDGGVVCAGRDRRGGVQRVIVPADADVASIDGYIRLLRERIQAGVRTCAR